MLGVQLTVPALTCIGLTILLVLASGAGPQALTGFICYLVTRNLRVVYSVSLVSAATWIVLCLVLDGITLGPVAFRSHELVGIANLPAFPVNLILSMLLAVIGIKIGYAFGDTCRRAQKRIKNLG